MSYSGTPSASCQIRLDFLYWTVLRNHNIHTFCLFNVDVNVVIVSQHPPPIIPFLLGCLSTCSYIFNGANQIHMETHTIKIWRLLQMAADVLVCLHTHTHTRLCSHMNSERPDGSVKEDLERRVDGASCSGLDTKHTWFLSFRFSAVHVHLLHAFCDLQK